MEISRDFIETNEAKKLLYEIRNMVHNTDNSVSYKMNFIQILDEFLEDIYFHSIRDLVLKNLYPFSTSNLEKTKLDERDLKNLYIVLRKINDTRQTILNFESNINSEEYYNNKIHELKERELALKKILEQNKADTEEQKQISADIETKLKIIEKELEEKKKKLEIKEKQEDAKSDWKSKINETFENLKIYLEPIENEHRRLNILYYTYAILGILTLLTIIICEFLLIYKISNIESIPNLNDYLIILLPLPIAGALMWGFIFQMNRAQRQLIAISNNIHSVKYIQGLLLAINNLSLDITDGVSRINSALDKVISNHLNKRQILNEKDFKDEESKDAIELEKVLRIISRIRE